MRACFAILVLSVCLPSAVLACFISQYTCDNGDCISGSYRCDGDNDCGDGSDEIGCASTPSCSYGQFTCYSGQCVLASDACDNYDDCSDGSDEDGCPDYSYTYTWGTGTYVGTVFGVIFFLVICAGLSTVYYRRRVVLMRTTTGAVVTSTQAVTMSRW